MEEKTSRPRACIIGAGPGGMSVLYQIKLHVADELDVECYEKQETWGGMWNYTWRTGTDEYGEHVHASMYRNMWTIGPKEVSEFADYSFKDHFGKLLPSYLPRDITRQYLHGRFTKGQCGDMTSLVHFRHVVTSVEYDNATDNFTVWVRDLLGNKDNKEIFSHVIVASGVFSVPNSPSFEGMSTFSGRIIHAHDFRDAKEFANQTVLIIGSRFSASEIAVQLIRFGTKNVICSYRKQPMEMKGTSCIEERPLLQRVDNKTIYFKDGTSAEVDSIILCTGYLYSYPFLQGSLKFDTGVPTCLMPDKIYKGTVWAQGGNNKLMFMAPFEVYFNFALYDIQGQWIYKYILQKLPNEPQPHDKMLESIKEWQERLTKIDSPLSMLTYQRDLLAMLANEVGHTTEYLDKAIALLVKCIDSRITNAWTYRNLSYPSLYTDEQTPAPDVRWEECLDEDALIKHYTE